MGPLVAAVAATLLPAESARAANSLDIYGVQAAAIELPSIYGLLRRPGDNTGGPLDQNSDPSNAFQAYLDTGTSGIILSQEYTDALGINNETAPSGTPVTFGDVAVNGSISYNVSEVLNLQLGRYTGEDIDTSTYTPAQTNAYFNQSTANVRLELNPTPVDPLSFQDPLNLVGMPAMIGKVVVFDSRLYNHLSGVDANLNVQYDSKITSLADYPADPGEVPYPQMQSWIYNKGQGTNSATPLFNPGVPHADYTVRLSYADLSRFTTTSPNEAGVVGPTFSHNPFIGPVPFTSTHNVNDPPGISLSRTITNSSTIATTTGSWLLDTGAQVSFMSSAEALALGIQLSFDKDGNPVLTDLATGGQPPGEFSLALGGAGGDAGTLLGFTVDELDLPTTTGDIVFHNVPVGVLDITVTDGTNSYILDGDFGMNLLLPSMDVNADNATGSQFDFVTFDEPDGELLLTNSSVDVPEPMTAAACLLCGGVLLRRSRRAARRW